MKNLVLFVSLAWPIVSAVLIAFLRTRTAAQWVALGESSPRAQGAIRALRGAGLDPVKVVDGIVQWITGRAPPDPREAELTRLRARVAELEGPAPPRASLVPSPVHPSGERGSVRVGALGAVVVAGLALALACAPRLPPVAHCAPRSWSCRDGRPHVCSASQRWEPAGDTPCEAVGGVCVVPEGGPAHCARPEGGAR